MNDGEWITFVAMEIIFYSSHSTSKNWNPNKNGRERKSINVVVVVVVSSVEVIHKLYSFDFFLISNSTVGSHPKQYGLVALSLSSTSARHQSGRLKKENSSNYFSVSLSLVEYDDMHFSSATPLSVFHMDADASEDDCNADEKKFSVSIFIHFMDCAHIQARGMEKRSKSLLVVLVDAMGRWWARMSYDWIWWAWMQVSHDFSPQTFPNSFHSQLKLELYLPNNQNRSSYLVVQCTSPCSCLRIQSNWILHFIFAVIPTRDEGERCSMLTNSVSHAQSM